MIRLGLVSLATLALAGCATMNGTGEGTTMASASETPAAPAAAPAAAATPAPALPAIPQGTGIFAQASTLPFEAPDFSKIKDSDYQPAIEQGIAIQKAEVAQIANNPEAPTFDNTIVALEKSGRMLTRVYNVFSAVQAADTNDTLDKIDSATSPQLAGLRDSILLDDKLFARVRAIYDARESLGLAPDQLQLLKITYDSMVHNGALLSAADKATLKGINEKISSLSTDFGQKLTAGTRDGALIVANKAQLAGMSPAGVAAAAKAASDRGKAGYLIPLQNTTQQPALSSLSDRATRKALFEQSWTRSEKGDANDTRADAAELAQLRAEKAKLLGYPDYASYALFDQMAKTPATAIRFMDGLVPPLRAEQDREVKALDAVIAKSGGKFAVKPWDWSYYAEKLRKAKYDLDDAQVKPYFEITNVLENGVFYAANQLYGLTFRKRTDIPVYNPDVTVYEVFDQDGSPMALFYFDPWKRDNKQGGAWMSNFVEQSTLLGTKPVVFNVENFTKPAAGQPALVSFDDVTTMFHEFGHALHGMLSNQRYPSIAGTSTARDFVEFPSQFNENWATDPKVLANYAKNYKTGAPMPKALMDKVIAAKKFNQGYDLGEIVAAALLDMKWHSLPASAGKQDVDAFEAKALGETGLDVANVPTRYRSSYFRHIWANGYAAGYYAYLWTEMLDHDAFQWFEDHGGLTRANGQRFRDMILSRGHSEDYGVMFRNFTGHDPEVGPMIKARGLDQVPAR